MIVFSEDVKVYLLIIVILLLIILIIFYRSEVLLREKEIDYLSEKFYKTVEFGEKISETNDDLVGQIDRLVECLQTSSNRLEIHQKLNKFLELSMYSEKFKYEKIETLQKAYEEVKKEIYQKQKQKK